MNKYCRDSKKHFISKCICGHSQVSPMPTQKKLKKFYDGDVHENVQVKSVLKKMNVTRKLVDTQIKRDTIRRIKYIPKSGSVLDIGAGYGNFIAIIKNKDKIGFDVSADRRNKSKIKLVNKLPTRNFDTVCMFHVLEHLQDPLAYLKKIKKIPNKLLIIEIPNANDIQLKNKKYNQYFWQISHLHYFTPNSIRMCLELAGFHDIKIEGVQRYTNKHSKISVVSPKQVPSLIKNLTCDTLLVTVKIRKDG